MSNVHINNAKELIRVHVAMVRKGTKLGPVMNALSLGRDLYVSAKLRSLDKETLENKIAMLFGLLYPHDDVDAPWDSDTLNDVSNIVLGTLDLVDVL